MSRRLQGIYPRGGRYWADFRAYTDVGGRREPLCAPGVRLATKDRKEAALLYGRRLEHYERLRHHKVSTGLAETASLNPYSTYHLEALKTEGAIRSSTIERYADALANVIERLGADIQLTEITPQRLTHYVGQRRHEQAAAQTIRHELVALSRLFKRAVAESRALTNPVALLHDKPRVVREEAVWLTMDEAADLLEAAKAYDARPKHHGSPIGFLYPLAATYLLTGGRKQEVFALRRADLDWENEVVRIRPYDGHTLKRGDGRAVRFWPQLQTILREYLSRAPAHISGLLFPSPTAHHRGGAEHWRLVDVREALDWAVRKAKITKHVSLHTFRHSYCATRLQTYEHGPAGQLIQVGVYQVARELGHRSAAMVEQVYAHIAPRPDRLQPEVRYERMPTPAIADAAPALTVA